MQLLKKPKKLIVSGTCRRCKRAVLETKLVWMRLGCERVSSDRVETPSNAAEMASHRAGECRGDGCDGCVFRTVSLRGERVRVYAV